MSEIISILPEELAEKQYHKLLKPGYYDYIGSITCLEGARGKLIGGVCCSENLMRNRMLDKSYVVLPLQFHEDNGAVVGVSIADSFPANSLPEAVISVERSEVLDFFKVQRGYMPGQRFSKTPLKEITAWLRLCLPVVIAKEVGLRYCENPDADLDVLKRLVPIQTRNHALRYGNNPNPHIEFLDMLDNINLCNFCYSYGRNEHATTEQFKFILEYIDSRYQRAIIEFARGYAERSCVDEDLVRQIIKHPSFDMAEVIRYLNISNKPNKTFLEQLNRWNVFL